MRLKIVLISLLFLSSCKSQSQSKHGKIEYDKNLKAKFGNDDFIEEGHTSIFLDSVLVDSGTIYSKKRNALIYDEIGNHYLLTSCSGYFVSDTLFIEFTTLNLTKSNKLILKVCKESFYADFVDGTTGVLKKAEPIKLILKNKIQKNSKEVIGSLQIQVNNLNSRTKHFFNGDFACSLK